MRERLVFDGRIQGHGANMKFLSKQPLYIKMTYTCRKHSVGGIGATHEAPPKLKTPPKEIRCILVQHFSLLCYSLFYWSANGCVSHRHGRDVADVFTVKWRSVITSQSCISAKLIPILLYFNTCPLFKSSTSWALSAPVLFIYFPASHLAKSLSWLRAGFQWWNVFLLFPFLSHRCLCLSMGTLGLRQSCVAMAAGYVAELRTPGIWSLSPQSPSLLFIPPFSQVSFGAAEAISTSFSLSLSLTYSVSAQSITPRSRLTYVMRHIYLKTKFMSILVPVPLSLPSIFPPPRFTFSIVVCTSFPSPFPCGGSNTALWDTTVPWVSWHTSLSPVYFETPWLFHWTVLQNLITWFKV